MRKTRLLMAFLMFPIIAFSASYNLWGLNDGGATHSSSSSYVLWGSLGKATCGKMSGGIYVLNGGYYYSGVEEGFPRERKPVVFSLSQNYPNPVISGTHIEYALPKATSITLKIYDVMGRAIRTLVAGSQKPGKYRVYWDGTDNGRGKVASGIYFYRMETSEFKSTKKMIVLR